MRAFLLQETIQTNSAYTATYRSGAAMTCLLYIRPCIIQKIHTIYTIISELIILNSFYDDVLPKTHRK